MGGGAGSAKSATASMGSAADRQVKMGEEWLSFAKEQFKVSQGRQTEIDALTKSNSELMKTLTQKQADFTKATSDRQVALADEALGISRNVAAKQMETADWQSKIAREDRERYETTFRPIEDQFIAEASTYGSEARQDEAAASAMADVQTAAAASRAAARRDATALGINPNSGRFAGIDRAGELGTALATAGAANGARTQQREKGLALKADLVNLGNGVASGALNTAAAATGTQNSAAGALNSGAALGIGVRNNAVANAGAATDGQVGAAAASTAGALNANSNFLNSTGLVGAGYSGASNGLSAATGIWANQQQRADNSSNALWSAIGTGAGLLLSDENVKEDKEPIEDGEALEAVRNMPVEKWRYKDGVADEDEHVGTYAQDFQEQTGSGDGHTIPIGDAIGITMKAVQDLASDVDAIKSAVGLGPSALRRAPTAARAAPPAKARAAVEKPTAKATAKPSRVEMAKAPGLRPREAA